MEETTTIFETVIESTIPQDSGLFSDNVVSLLIFIILFIGVLAGILLGSFLYNFFK